MDKLSNRGVAGRSSIVDQIYNEGREAGWRDAAEWKAMEKDEIFCSGYAAGEASVSRRSYFFVGFMLGLLAFWAVGKALS